VDGFRFDLASILTRAPSIWHPSPQNEEGETVGLHSGGAATDPAGVNRHCLCVCERSCACLSLSVCNDFACACVLFAGVFVFVPYHVLIHLKELSGSFPCTPPPFLAKYCQQAYISHISPTNILFLVLNVALDSKKDFFPHARKHAKHSVGGWKYGTL